jgi:hypothetical protein
LSTAINLTDDGVDDVISISDDEYDRPIEVYFARPRGRGTDFFDELPKHAYPLSTAVPGVRGPPVGVLLGVWKQPGLPTTKSNGVYGAVDPRGQVVRVISAIDPSNRPVTSNLYIALLARTCVYHRVRCGHHDIWYLERFAGMRKWEVDAAVREYMAAPYLYRNQ